MFSQKRLSFESPNVVDSGDLPPSRPSRHQSQRTAYSDGALTSRGAGHRPNYTDEEDLRTRFKPPLPGFRHSRTIKLDLTRMSDNHNEEYSVSDNDASVVEFEDEANSLDNSAENVAETSTEGSPARSPSMDTARLFAVTLLAESERRQSTRSILTDDASVRSTGSSMRWPRRGRRQEFRGLRGAASQEEDESPSDFKMDVRLHTREGLMKVQTQRRQLLWIRVLILLVALGLSLCFSIFAARAIRARHHRQEVTRSPTHNSRDPSDFPKILDIFLDNGISSEEDLRNPLSPQYKALSWLVLTDPEQADVGTEQFIQRYALAVLYYSWNGPRWTRSLNFLSPQHECGWYSYETNDNGEPPQAFGVSCDEQLRIRSLMMPSNALGGSIPDEIQYLSDLDFLDLQANSLTGSLPPSFEFLSSLEYLDLNFNELTGPLPAYLGDFSRLAVLGLSQNQLTGELPLSLGSLSHLKTLAIDDNFLDGTMKPIASMTHLRYLYARGNNFDGPIDQGLLDDLTHLTELDLSNNAFHADVIPASLFGNPRLRVLDLHGNQIHGTLPDSFPKNDGMEFLSLRDNFVSSTIPSQLGNLRALTHLDLENNSFTGTIPASALSTINSLTHLFLGKNSLSRTAIPDELQYLRDLKELSLDSLHLTGSFPAWIADFSHLRLLDLRSNSLTGSIPVDFFNVEQLTYVLLNDNLLTGEIPFSLGTSPELQMVSLHHNGFLGQAGSLCSATSQVEFLTVDCEVVECPCCTTCCEGEGCYKDMLWDALEHKEGEWQENFERSDYGFNPQILFAIVEPKGSK